MKPKPIDWKEESQRFDGVAEIYDAYRPSYPPELIDTIISISGIQPGQSILEIGCGTGIATRLFAQKGLSILCLEPGRNLLNVAARNLKACPQVRFANARFEDWHAGAARFDLIYSAQAFHWVPEEVRLVKTAALLKEHGYLAVFWNKYPGMDNEIGRELDRVYKDTAPEIAGSNMPSAETMRRRAESLSGSGLYEHVKLRTYPWSVHYTTEGYLGLLNTYSDHLRLPDKKRHALFDEIATVIEQYGGSIEKPYLAVLYLARRKSQ